MLVLPLTYGIALLLRLGHNRCCQRRRELDAQLYREAYAGADLRQVVEEMARSRRRELRTKRLVIPAQLIGYMIENSGSDLALAEGCRRYLEAWLEESEPARSGTAL